MTKKLATLLFCLLLILGIAASASADSAQNIKVFINGEQLTFAIEPEIHSGTTLVPLRGIMEAMGAEVNWDSKTQTITSSKDNTTIILKVNNTTATKNGQTISLAVAPRIKNNSTLVPLRLIAESFACEVLWEPATATINIITADNTTTSQTSGPYTVTRVVDGDTIVVSYKGTEEKVRLIGVDTPESVSPDASKNTPYGKIASDFTTSQLTNQKITLEFDVQTRDKYGRLLSYVYLDGQMFNKILLQTGHAAVATFPPNVKYVEDFLALEKAAQAQKVGIWENYQAKTTGKYVASKDSDKYHLPDCRWVKNIQPENLIYFDTEEDAVAAGYSPCGTCKP